MMLNVIMKKQETGQMFKLKLFQVIQLVQVI